MTELVDKTAGFKTKIHKRKSCKIYTLHIQDGILEMHHASCFGQDTLHVTVHLVLVRIAWCLRID